jgi:hypothetical protein
MMFTVLREDSILHIPNNLFFQKMFRVTDSARQSFFEHLERDAMTASANPAAVPHGQR